MQERNAYTTAVRQDVVLGCVDEAGNTMSLNAELGYDPAEPYAVSATFRTAGGDIVWTFARELLVQGLASPAGDGDVHVWPCLDEAGRAIVIVELSSPDGELLVQIGSKDAYRFVNRALAAVPLGTEGDHLDLDLLVQQLLEAA
jgi:hypothetical protein